MTTDERSALAASTAAAGWKRHQDERVDVYMQGINRVRVIWQGDSAISGASRFYDEVMETFTRDLGTVRSWLGLSD